MCIALSFFVSFRLIGQVCCNFFSNKIFLPLSTEKNIIEDAITTGDETVTHQDRILFPAICDCPLLAISYSPPTKSISFKTLPTYKMFSQFFFFSTAPYNEEHIFPQYFFSQLIVWKLYCIVYPWLPRKVYFMTLQH